MPRVTRTSARKSLSAAKALTSPRKTLLKEEPSDKTVVESKSLETSNWERALKCRKFVGAHVSAAGGPQNSIPNAQKIGATALALFLTSQRKWEGRQLTDQECTEFKEAQKESHLEHILPHGSYLVNLGNPNEETRDKSFKAFLQDLQRCERLGISLYNFQ